MSTSAIIWDRNSLYGLTSHLLTASLSQTCTLSYFLLYSVSQVYVSAASPKHLTDHIRLPFQEIPEWFLSLCPQLEKKGKRKTNRYQHPSCDLAHKEI